jgi:drug/metabolite transporter (DMT)-like permease
MRLKEYCVIAKARQMTTQTGIDTLSASLPGGIRAGSNDKRAFAPILCLLAAVILLSSITPVIKYVFQHSDLHPIGIAGFRVTIGFFFLLLSTLLWDRGQVGEAKGVGPADTAKLTLVGLLGVASYGVAAWGLLYTSVTHYILIYSLMPCFTAMFSCLWGKEVISPVKLIGILISLGGCLMAISDGVLDFGLSSGVGDGLVMLFTIMMAAHLVLSSGVAKQFRPLPANALMFGGSSLVLSLLMVLVGATGWPAATLDDFSPLTGALVIYVGAATAAVFLLRYLSLRSMTPMTVGVYHNLVPAFAILIACLCLDEVVEVSTIAGGLGIIAGAELVRRAPSIRWKFENDWHIDGGCLPDRTDIRTA